MHGLFGLCELAQLENDTCIFFCGSKIFQLFLHVYLTVLLLFFDFGYPFYFLSFSVQMQNGNW